MKTRMVVALALATGLMACGGSELGATLTDRLEVPLTASEQQADCFNRVKQSVLDGLLAIEVYEVELVTQCGEPIQETAGSRPRARPMASRFWRAPGSFWVGSSA